MYKVVVAGSRQFNDYALLEEKLDKILSLKQDVQIVSGKARGADTLAIKYAKEKGLSLKKFPADWGNEGYLAGFKRNVQMAQYADAVVAFWDGKSTGTQHMIRMAIKYQLQLRIIKFKP